MDNAILQSKNIEGIFDNVKNKYPKVILSKIIGKFIEADKALSQFNLRRYLQISFYEVFNLVQDLFKFTDENNEFLIVFKLIYTDWLKFLSLTIPHICEELWELSGYKTFLSTNIWDAFNQDYINNEIEDEFEYISTLIEDILNIKKIVKDYKTNKVYIYMAPKWMYKVLDVINSKEGNFDEIIMELKKDGDLMRNKQLIPFLKSQLKDRVWEKKLPKIDEVSVVEQFKPYIEKKVNSTIIIDSNFDPKMRGNKTKPFKPGLFIDA